MVVTSYGDYQNDIYSGGLEGRLPRYPVDFPSLESKAAQALPGPVYSYVASGCGDEGTQRANVAAFDRYVLTPRMLVGAADRDLSVSLFGMSVPTPIFLSPIGVVGLCAQDGHGDLHAAEASARTGVPMIASTLSQDRLEEVAAHTADTPALFQLYTPNDRDIAANLMGRAERAGYRAIVITLDTWVTGWRPRDLNTANFPQLRGFALANYFTDPVFCAQLAEPPETDPAAAIAHWSAVFGNPLRWEDLLWLRESTSLPLLLKGIQHPDDARRAQDYGIDGIYCSNHGGRQANGGLPALDALPAVVQAAGALPVLFDSGVRSGSDVAKALALGATAVGIGRPYAYAMAVGGADAVMALLRAMLAELDLLMAIDGFPTLADLRRAEVQRL
ncbi:alpha-hydroxy-acid oxidizing protein [Nocardia brevicatena]|uniref:alpha-hydroxy-acid oxidizing protein n=1 Tax=Nocardia brevicatena TaxID=37327 RepID=UPI0002D88CB4|nr:alpha-hydroxy-acid oxidizing protein [Nocardia brevicatena]